MDKIWSMLTATIRFLQADFADMLGGNNGKNQMHVNHSRDLMVQQMLGRVPSSVNTDIDSPTLELEWQFYCAK